MKTKIIPFDLEMAKKIQSGEIEGRIVNRDDYPARIICFDPIHPTASFIGLVLYPTEDHTCTLEKMFRYFSDGRVLGCSENFIHNLYLELPEEASNIIDSKSLYEKWTDIQDSLIELFREKAVKNNVKFSDADLVHYAAELFTWFRETHLIFKFRLDKLEELKQYAEEHIMEPSWCSEAKQNIKKIFGLESSKHEFKPFDKVLVKYDKEGAKWFPTILSQVINGLYVNVADKVFKECIPYEGNEHLVGTTNKPKEE